MDIRETIESRFVEMPVEGESRFDPQLAHD